MPDSHTDRSINLTGDAVHVGGDVTGRDKIIYSVEGTSGFFVVTPEDEGPYPEFIRLYTDVSQYSLSGHDL